MYCAFLKKTLEKISLSLGRNQNFSYFDNPIVLIQLPFFKKDTLSLQYVLPTCYFHLHLSPSQATCIFPLQTGINQKPAP